MCLTTHTWTVKTDFHVFTEAPQITVISDIGKNSKNGIKIIFSLPCTSHKSIAYQSILEFYGQFIYSVVKVIRVRIMVQNRKNVKKYEMVFQC